MIAYGLKKWCHYLFRIKIIANTDHASLTSSHTYRQLTGGKGQTVGLLSEFPVNIVQRLGNRKICTLLRLRKFEQHRICELKFPELVNPIQPSYSQNTCLQGIHADLRCDAENDLRDSFSFFHSGLLLILFKNFCFMSAMLNRVFLFPVSNLCSWKSCWNFILLLSVDTLDLRRLTLHCDRFSSGLKWSNTVSIEPIFEM